MKTCRICGQQKPIKNYEKKKEHSGGRINICGKCRYIQRQTAPSWESRQASTAAATKKWCSENQQYFKIYMIKWQRKNAKHYETLIRASGIARLFIKEKGITRRPCQICGNQKTHMHHRDYSAELSVVFLCSTCHRRVHHQLIDCPAPIDLRQVAGNMHNIITNVWL